MRHNLQLQKPQPCTSPSSRSVFLAETSLVTASIAERGPRPHKKFVLCGLQNIKKLSREWCGHAGLQLGQCPCCANRRYRTEGWHTTQAETRHHSTCCPHLGHAGRAEHDREFLCLTSCQLRLFSGLFEAVGFDIQHARYPLAATANNWLAAITAVTPVTEQSCFALLKGREAVTSSTQRAKVAGC